ncbi:Estradiol 17-beta-dehydrogenase 2 [Araneus ventricosus]|uniref:Estradiol 17-beta-dehydrogenase 2 n=1 Tax=Araneus ventricosus TaxID=182803 RepID=A0A4Y2N217_ARAVE|nr:Estradiol 17-beta-dehydrogenase 2 [Araneus ventricosus]
MYLLSGKVVGMKEKFKDKPDESGCARGIGNALAKHLDKKGFHVFASCRDPKSPGAEDLRKSCSSRLRVFQLDVANDESVQKAVQFVEDNLSTCELWAIINNAGIQQGFFLELSSIQDFKDSLEVNALGPARVTKAFLPLLRQSRGRVINMSSVIGRLAVPMTGPYCMSKFACDGFSESLRYDLDMWGVKIISIEPEFFETDMTTEMGLSERVDVMCAKIDEDVRKDYGEEFLKAFKHMITTIFPPSPNMQKLVEAIECAVSLKHPGAVYKVCRNVGVRALLTVWDVLPEELKVFIFRIVSTLFGLPKLGQTKKSS